MRFIILEGSIDYPYPSQRRIAPSAYRDIYQTKRYNYKLLDDLSFDVEEYDSEMEGWFVEIESLEGLAFFLQETDAMVVWYNGNLGLLFGIDRYFVP